jgi:hypothetical protein
MRNLRVLFVALLVVSLTAACSSGGSSGVAKKTTTTTEAPGSTTTTETPALDPDQIDTNASPYCATWAEIRGAGAPKTQDADAVKAHYAKLIPTVEKLLGQATSDIKPAVQVALDATRKVVASGSLDAFQGPGVQDAQRKLTDYSVAHCAKK